MEFKNIICTVDDSVGIIKFNRPHVLNSFNSEMSFEVRSALMDFSINQSVRCILITGEGKGFCAGQDLSEAIPETGDPPPINEIVKNTYNPLIKLLRKIEKPIIAGVNGVAAGAGANIALACDIVAASSEASFIQSFSRIGLVPDSGGTFFLPRLIGLPRAAAFMMLGEKVTAEEAASIGMIYKVFPAENFSDDLIYFAKYVSKLPTKGLALTKKALNQSFINDLNEQLDLEEQLQGEAGKTFDYNEGVKAFQEKRKPNFRGE